MELRHLRYFVAVAEELNFTKAAEKVRVAQPSLTVQIRNLEEEIGVRLFDRAKNRIALTDCGRAFLADARRLLAECAESVRAVQRLGRGEAGQLTIGCVANIFYEQLPVTLERFARICPGIDLHLVEMCPGEQYRALDERRIDLGFILLEPQPNGCGIQRVRVGEEMLMVAAHERNPLASEVRIELASLSGSFFVARSDKAYPGARAWLVETCRGAGFAPRVLQEAESETGVMSFVAAGLGVALVPQSFTHQPHERVVFRPLRVPLRMDCYAMWRTDNSSQCLKRYVEIVQGLSASQMVGNAGGISAVASGRPARGARGLRAI